jgi:protein SCO1/2
MNARSAIERSARVRQRRAGGALVALVRGGLVLGGLALGGLALVAPPASAAQLNNAVPRGTEGVEIVQRVGESLPLDLPFVDHLARPVRLGDYFEPGRPVLLSLNYSDCPMLCVVQLDGVVEVLNQLPFAVGEDFQVVTVSLDPREAPSKAQRTRAHYLSSYERGAELGDDAWPFLTGPQSSIDALAGALGFGYRFLPETGEFAHDAALMLATPEGTVSRYFFGIRYEPSTLRLSLVEASEGRLGGLVDQLSMLCFVFDHEAGAYVAEAFAIMRLGGLVTVVVLGGFLLTFWRQEIFAALGRLRSGTGPRPSLESVSRP